MLDLLDLRCRANESMKEAPGAASRGDDDRFGRQDDLLAGGRQTDRDFLHPAPVPNGRGVPAENPVLEALAQHLDQSTFRKASFERSDGP
jgi:hypothetical protein